MLSGPGLADTICFSDNRMKSGNQVLVGVACALGISLAYQTCRQGDTAATGHSSTGSRTSEAARPAGATGRWLVSLEPKTESHIDGIHIRLKNPTDRPVPLALWSRDEPEVDPGLVKRRRADGVTGYRWRLCLYDGAGGHVEQMEMPE